MQLINQARLSLAALAALERALPAHGTLWELTAWGRTQQPPVTINAVIAQDEYTLDVIASWRDGLTLVYGAT